MLRGPVLLTGVFLLSGCGSSREGSVVLKTPVDLNSIGAPPRKPITPQKNPAAAKKTFVPG